MPPNVRQLRVLVVGGGHGGGSGSGGGGGSGYVHTGEFDVEPSEVITVTVGRGGQGSTSKVGLAATGACRQDSRSGGITSFGHYLSARGGAYVPNECDEYAWAGGAGGSGGGSGCILNCTSGRGGSGGSDGARAKGRHSFGYGVGQGKFEDRLRKIFTLNNFTAGAGGSGVYGWEVGGGGGGGVLFNGSGPRAQSGEGGAEGGQGYGAGGGGGHLFELPSKEEFIYYAGGAGADGLAYVEW